MTSKPDPDSKSGNNPIKGKSTPDRTVILEAPRELGCYRLTKMLGRGGMGEVWQAFDTHLERDVAIKLMRKELLTNEDATRRFAREARAVARLNHPNIVHVYAFGDENGITYFAMEMVDGETVSQRLKRSGKLSLSEALSVTMQAIEGLSYANARGIIHRDIKPSNLMVTETSQVKIADFGLAKIVEHDTQMTAAGTAMGSPNYMSPEQARGEEADHRSDIYALGISLYQMLCDCLPFTAHSPVSVLLKQIQDPLPEPEDLKTLCNGDVMTVLKKMTDKSPENRYNTYGELATAIAGLQPDILYKGAHGITSSMPIANTPQPGALRTGSAGQSDPLVRSTLTVSPETPLPTATDAKQTTPPDFGTSVVSSRDISSGEINRDPQKQKPWLIPILATLGALLLAVPIAWYFLSENETEPVEVSRNTVVVQTGKQAPILSSGEISDPTPAANTPTATPQPAVTPMANSTTTANPKTGMQPVNITALLTPRPSLFPGQPTTVTPMPKLADLMPKSIYQSHGKAAPTPVQPLIYVLGTAGAGPNEQIPTYLDKQGKTPHKPYRAGSEVTVISASSTMVRAEAPDGKVVYIYKKMTYPKQ